MDVWHRMAGVAGDHRGLSAGTGRSAALRVSSAAVPTSKRASGLAGFEYDRSRGDVG